ncbi:MAG: YitT family protein [Eubacteriales bacterium]
MNRQKTLSTIRDYVVLTFASFLMGFGIYVFRFPNNFSFGGVTGIAVLLAKMLPLSASTITFILNLILLVVGIIVLGKSFGLKTAYSTIILSVSLSLLEIIFPMSGPLTDEPLLECCFAVIIPSLASAIIFNLDASSGGTDIIAMIVNKYTSINIGTSLMIADLLVALTAFTFSAETGLFSVLGWFTKSLVIDSVIESINMFKVFTIVCNDPTDISRFITETLDRSATIVEASGAYTRDKRYVITSIVSRNQAVRLRNYIRKNTPDAFLSISNSSEIIGNGFRTHI